MFQSKRWTRAFCYFTSGPIDLGWGWPLVLLCAALWGERLRWEDGVLRCRARPGTWLRRRFQKNGWGALTVSPHAIIYGALELWPEDRPSPHPRQPHEHAHVEQGEAAQNGAFLAAVAIALPVVLAGAPITGATVGAVRWVTGYLELALVARLTAWLRGEPPVGKRSGDLVGSHLEEAARTAERPEHDYLRRR